MVGCVSSKESIRPRIPDDVVIHVIAKGGIFESTFFGSMNNGIVFC